MSASPAAVDGPTLHICHFLSSLSCPLMSPLEWLGKNKLGRKVEWCLQLKVIKGRLGELPLWDSVSFRILCIVSGRKLISSN